MIYECDQCHAPLPPSVKTCPKCGEGFDDPVPPDAIVPTSGFTAKSTNSGFINQNSESSGPARQPGRLRFMFLVIVLAAVGLGAVTIFALSHNDPHNLKITDSNKSNFTETIKDSKGLTVDENRMLMAYMMRYSIGSSMEHDETLNPIGKTVGELVNNERDFETKQKQQEADQARLTAATQAKENALHVELREDILLTVVSKGFEAADYQANRMRDAISLSCVYKNRSKKGIRAFTGIIQFSDLFGKKIKDVHMTITDPIEADNTGDWFGSLNYNQFMDDDIQLRNTSLSDMKVEWLPSSIIYSDGSTVGDPNADTGRT